MVYRVVFKNNNGLTFSFGFDNIFDMKGNSGIPVTIGKSQGFAQIGETVQSLSVQGNAIAINGYFFPNAVKIGKDNIKRVITPLSSGQLIFNDKYYIDVNVKTSPLFSPIYKDCKFYVEFFAHYPFWKKLEQSVYALGGVIPRFIFPINYNTPHKFGDRSGAAYGVVTNNGDFNADFKVVFTSKGHVENIILTDLETFQKTSFTSAILEVGEQLVMYRDSSGYIRVEHVDASGRITDKFHWLDEDSSLFDLRKGDNIIKSEAVTQPQNLTAQIIFNEVQTGVYDE